jgi:phytoene dehydrogenase-like protein
LAREAGAVRIVVVGAGVGGLVAAVRLAAAGHRVVVHERAPTVGGKLGRYARDGYAFDTGPSLFTLPQVFDDLDLRLDTVPLEPVVRHVFPDGSVLDSSADPDVFAARIADAFGAGAADDWRRLWRRAGRIWDASWRDILRTSVDSPLALAGLAWHLGDLAAIAPGVSLRALGRRYLRDPRLRMILDRYATYTGADPRRSPAALAAVPYAELAFGGWYLRGGLGTLADALVARCAELGGRRTGARSAAGVRGASAGGRGGGERRRPDRLP